MKIRYVKIILFYKGKYLVELVDGDTELAFIMSGRDL